MVDCTRNFSEDLGGMTPRGFDAGCPSLSLYGNAFFSREGKLLTPLDVVAT